jgi:hypothetical protein
MPLALCAAAGFAACSGHADGAPGLVQSIAIQPQSAALCVGDSLTFSAHVLDAGGHPVAGAQVRWSSSAPEAVAIDTASGVARALAFGAAQITATSGGVRSQDPAGLEVPLDLSPEFVPDTTVLAPGDTMTLGVRLRRLGAGAVPNRTPQIAPFDSPIAALDSAGLVRAKTIGTTGLSLSACGFSGHGAVRVFTPPDSATGLAYLWLSGPMELRVSLPAQANNFFLTNGRPAFQVFSRTGGNSRVFLYEDTVSLGGIGVFPLDSLLTSEIAPTLACAPPRPFATYNDQSLTTLLGMHGGSTAVTTYVPVGNHAVISGRTVTRMRGVVAGVPTLDTLQAIYTFSAPLVSVSGACHQTGTGGALTERSSAVPRRRSRG